MKIYVDNYLVDAAIDRSRGAPVAGRRGGGRPGAAGRGGGNAPIDVTPMARGVWRITGGTMVIEFADHMTLFEVDGQPARIKQVIEAARRDRPCQAGHRSDRLAPPFRSHVPVCVRPSPKG